MSREMVQYMVRKTDDRRLAIAVFQRNLPGLDRP